MASKYDLKQIDPNEVEYSRDNPRGEEEEDILKTPNLSN